MLSSEEDVYTVIGFKKILLWFISVHFIYIIASAATISDAL